MTIYIKQMQLAFITRPKICKQVTMSWQILKNVTKSIMEEKIIPRDHDIKENN